MNDEHRPTGPRGLVSIREGCSCTSNMYQYSRTGPSYHTARSKIHPA